MIAKLSDPVKEHLMPGLCAFGWRVASPLCRAEHTAHRFLFGYTYSGGPVSVYGDSQWEAIGHSVLLGRCDADLRVARYKAAVR